MAEQGLEPWTLHLPEILGKIIRGTWEPHFRFEIALLGKSRYTTI